MFGIFFVSTKTFINCSSVKGLLVLRSIVSTLITGASVSLKIIFSLKLDSLPLESWAVTVIFCCVKIEVSISFDNFQLVIGIFPS